MTKKTAEERINELQQKIAGITAREERRKLRKDPVAVQTRLAIKALNKAAAESTDEAVRVALVQARNLIAQTMEIVVVTAEAAPVAPAPKKTRAQRRQEITGAEA
ncbi:MAG: hypothetical protein ACRETX_09875 [Steroidobacteraceae bacterium]